MTRDNALNQPKLAWSNGTQGGGAYLWFGFDPLGRCVKRWYAQADGSGATPVLYFVYDGCNLVQEGTSPWNPSHFYFHGARVDEIVASYNGVTGVMAYHYYDASGHCTMLTDWQGNIMEQYYYDAFGYPYFFDGLGNGLGYSPHGNRFLFTGREWIEPLKVYDFRNRLYHPEVGRFMQPDPKEFAAGDYNLCRYCHNDPVNRSDPLGLWWDVPKQLRDDFNRARAYLSKDEGMKAMFAAVDASDTRVVVGGGTSMNPGDTGTERVTNTKTGETYIKISWNPHAASRFRAGTQSPAMVLGHEGFHAIRMINDPVGALRDSSPLTKSSGFKNAEEKRIVLGPETTAARNLPESAREAYEGAFYKVDSVTSHP